MATKKKTTQKIEITAKTKKPPLRIDPADLVRRYLALHRDGGTIGQLASVYGTDERTIQNRLTTIRKGLQKEGVELPRLGKSSTKYSDLATLVREKLEPSF